FAPSIVRMGPQPKFSPTARTAPVSTAHQPHRLDTVRTSCTSPAPSEAAATAQPPMPSTVAPAETSVNTGLTRETAAVCAVSRRATMKNRAVMLYTTTTKTDRIDGPTSETIACQVGLSRKSASLFCIDKPPVFDWAKKRHDEYTPTCVAILCGSQYTGRNPGKQPALCAAVRSEERRVGKERRAGMEAEE